LSQRKAGRILQVSGQSIGRWLKKYVDALPAQPPKPATSEVTELDELYTFVKSKKQTLPDYSVKTRCFMSWSLVAECTTEAILDQVPNTFQFCSDGYAGYRQVNYRRSRHLVGRGKSQTYSVEANNAELRCFVSQLARRTRGFAKSDAGLRRAITLFVHCWNARQMLRQLYPKYRRGLSEFISL
jgi:IS1 family transposase